MRYVLLLVFIPLSSFLKAQTDTSYVSTDVESNVYSIDFQTSKNKVIHFIKSQNIPVIYQNETKTDLRIKFVIDRQRYILYDSLANTLGFLSSKKVNTVSNYAKVREINLETSYLKQKRNSYLDMIKRLDEKSENYLTLWNDLKATEEKIFNKERELIGLNGKENSFTVTLDLNDETTSPENTGVSFVNMPGFEYSFLKIENPKSGLSAHTYQGYFLKYLFTRGKSFGTIGVYKSSDTGSNDSTTYSELFVLGFGQDFYSRHLGRGTRKFFNLYSGYTVGGILATNKNDKSNMLFIAPSIGLELFKNNYFLIDSKVNYFVPLNNNRYLRGWSYNASFNFVF